jgi:uncharacterized protein (TIGR03086 family)
MGNGIDGVTALEQAYEELGRLTAALAVGGLDEPSGCEGWDVRALLDHVLGAGLMYTAVNAGRRAGEDAGSVIGDDAVSAVARVARANCASWRAPGALEGERTYPWGTLPAAAGLASNIGEVAVHGHDLARATGQRSGLDPQVAQLVYDFYAQVPMDGLRAKGAYGPLVTVPDSASIQQRLLGLLGRHP